MAGTYTVSAISGATVAALDIANKTATLLGGDGRGGSGGTANIAFRSNGSGGLEIADTNANSSAFTGAIFGFGGVNHTVTTSSSSISSRSPPPPTRSASATRPPPAAAR